MIEGVEILSTAQVAAEITHNYWLAGVIFLAVIVFGAFCGGISDKEWRARGCLLGGCFGVLIGFLVWAGVCVVTAEATVYETIYKVTIDDSVSMNEFLDKYEIIDQEGKIYTVKERE